MVDMLLNDKSAEDPVTPTDGAGERQSATLTQSVYAQLRADILSGRMRPLELLWSLETPAHYGIWAVRNPC